MLLLDQRQHKVGIVADGAAASGGFADKRGDIDEQIERALRLMAAEAVNGGQTLQHVITALAVDCRPLFQQILRAFQHRHRRRLGQGGDAAAVLGIDVAHGVNQCLRAAAESQPPAGHRVGFRYAIHRQHPVKQRRHHFGEGTEGHVVVDQMFIDVIGHDPDLRIAQHHLADCL